MSALSQWWRVTASCTNVASAVSVVIEAPTAHRAVALFARKGLMPADSFHWQ
jgi:hypothetical protein